MAILPIRQKQRTQKAGLLSGPGCRSEAIRATRTQLLEELFGPDGAPDTLGDKLLRTSDVAVLFQVSERTVSEWGRRGRIPSVLTPSGHRRYSAAVIRDLLIAASEGRPGG